MMTPRLGLIRDERGLIGGFLIKTLLFLGIVGLAGYEGGHILIADLSAQSAADRAAATGAAVLASTDSVEQARQAAINAVHDADPGSRVTAFEAHGDGIVLVTVVKRVETLVVQHVGFLRKWGRVEATGEGRPPA
jgi:Flp pilus assembly protein TadG